MSARLQRVRPRPSLLIPQRKHVDFEPSPHLGSLSPNLQPNSPPTFPHEPSEEVLKVGRYILAQADGNNSYSAINCDDNKEFICKVLDIDKYRQKLTAYWQVDSHSNVCPIHEILLCEKNAYIFFEKSKSDLHTHVRQKRRLSEAEARRLFQQVAAAVAHCHENGVILRDLKLRKFVFRDDQQSWLQLEGLEDALVLEDDGDDQLSDKHGCPAYVSPEILHCSHLYSGKSADIWSLGVILYTMLVGRYPFHDTEPTALFGKIRRGHFSIPDSVSSKAKCLIRCMLRRDPNDRLLATEILQHPWLRQTAPGFKYMTLESTDQTVPDFVEDQDTVYV